MLTNCRQYRNSLTEWARGTPPDAGTLAHYEQCTSCARFLDEQRALSGALAALAAEPLPAPEFFQTRVMAEVDARLERHAPAGARVWRWLMACAMAATVLISAVWSLHTLPAPPQKAEQQQAVNVFAVEEADFVPIPYTVPLSPSEPTTVLRMRIPVARLRAVGYQVTAADPNAVIEADVLVSQDGRARAIRPVMNSN